MAVGQRRPQSAYQRAFLEEKGSVPGTKYRVLAIKFVAKINQKFAEYPSQSIN
jgi:hypothetical protein